MQQNPGIETSAPFFPHSAAASCEQRFALCAAQMLSCSQERCQEQAPGQRLEQASRMMRHEPHQKVLLSTTKKIITC